MSTMETELVGRGARDGRRLFEEWFDGLTQAADEGRPAAYVFVMGSLCEILRAFDMPVVFPEIHALQTAVRRVADEYLSEAEDHGFSPDVCGYVKADYALQLRGGEHPMGRIPKPALAVLTNACNTYLKWGEIWERLYDPRVVTIDVPGTRRPVNIEGMGPGPGAREPEGFERDRRYVEGQIRELIGTCEEVTGKKFDIDRLREVLRLTNDMAESWRDLLALNRSRPAGFDAMLEGTIYLGVANVLRGTEEGAAYFRDLVEEMEHRTQAGVGPMGGRTEERHRLIFVGVPCYPMFRRFYELFSEWGGVFVSSSYTWFASGGLDEPFAYDLERPIESLAEGVLRSVRHAVDSLMFQDRALLRAVDEFDADGVVYHPIKSCRTVSTGLAASRRAVLDARDVLCLYIESDMMDKRVVSEAQLKNRIDAFFEGLESRRIRKGGQSGGELASSAGTASAAEGRSA